MEYLLGWLSGSWTLQSSNKGLKMRKTSDLSFDCAVRDSLSTIKQAHVRLHLLTGTCATAARLTSEIELYDLLLGEISGIHTSLAKDLKRTLV
jgi:hypothetical protein